MQRSRTRQFVPWVCLLLASAAVRTDSVEAQQDRLDHGDGGQTRSTSETDDPLPPPLPSVYLDDIEIEIEQDDRLESPLAEQLQLPEGDQVEPLGPPARANHVCRTRSCCPEPTGRCGPYSRAFRNFKRRMQYSHWGFPEYFDEPPLGAAVAAAREVQIAQGLRDQMFLHHVDFYPDDTPRAEMLTPYGQRRLYELGQKCLAHGLPLYIESTVGQPQLDQARHRFVVEFCELHEVGLPADLIVVGEQHRGVSGIEAAEIYRNMLNQTQSGGAPASSATPGAQEDNATVAPTAVP